MALKDCSTVPANTICRPVNRCLSLGKTSTSMIAPTPIEASKRVYVAAPPPASLLASSGSKASSAVE